MNPMEWYGVESMMNHFVTRLEEIVAAQGDQITSRLEGMENQLSDLTASVEALKAAVAGVTERVDARLATLSDALDSVTTQLADERSKYDALVVAEDAEDVVQNQELADAKAATDAALADASTAAQEIEGAVSDLNNVASDTPAPTTPDTQPVPEPSTPVEEAPAETPAEPTV